MKKDLGRGKCVSLDWPGEEKKKKEKEEKLREIPKMKEYAYPASFIGAFRRECQISKSLRIEIHILKFLDNGCFSITMLSYLLYHMFSWVLITHRVNHY